MLSPRRDSPWEVVEHKHVAQVPTFFDDPDVEISSISSHDISQTFTFDRPIGPTAVSTSQSSSPTASTCSKRERLRSKLRLHRRSSQDSSESSASRRYSSYSTSSRSSSSTLSDQDDSDPEHAYRATWPRDFSPAQMKEALIFARSQLINSTEFRRMGGNVLFFEGWELTKLRKGSQHRLEIRYAGRPAMATYKSSPSSTSPPFMDILADVW